MATIGSRILMNRWRLHIPALVLILAAAAPQAETAPGCTDFSTIRPWVRDMNWLVYDMDVMDGFVVTVAHTTLRVVDISEPWAPRIIGAVDLPPSASRCAVSGSLTFVLGRDSLTVVDCSDPAAPVVGGSLWVGDDLNSMAVRGDHCLIAAGYDGLRIIDASDPMHPALVDSVETTLPAQVVRVDGDRAYVTEWLPNWPGREMKVVDVASPAEPSVLASIDITGSSRLHAVRQGIAYMVAGGSRIHTLDVSDPATPVPLDEFQFSRDVRSIHLQGDQAVVSLRLSVQVIDVSDPADLTRVGSIGLGFDQDSIEATAVSGDVLLTAHVYGFRIRSIAGETAPLPEWNTLYESSLQDITLQDGLGFAPFGNNAMSGGLEILDMSDPDSPVLLGRHRTSQHLNYARAVALHDTLACVVYVDGDARALEILDVSDPSQPTLACPTSDAGGWDVATQDGHAVIAAGEDGLLVVDLSDLFPLRIIGSLTLPGSPRGICLDDGIGYVSCLEGGLQIVDLSTPSAPAVIGELNPGGGTFAFTIEDGIGYLANSENLYVVDITDPGSPTVIGTPPYRGDNGVSDITIANGFAYGMGSSLNVFDVTVPIAPTMLGAVPRRVKKGLGLGNSLLLITANGDLVSADPQCDGSTPIEAPLLTGGMQDGAVVMNWSGSPGGPPGEFRMTARSGTETWTVPISGNPEDGFTAVDASDGLADGMVVTYQLQHTLDGTHWYRVDELTVTIEIAHSPQPDGFAWLGVGPNPAGAGTTIRWRSDDAFHLSVRIHDLAGRRVHTLHDGMVPEGEGSLAWDGRSEDGRLCPAGVYFMRLQADGEGVTRKISLIR